MKKSRRPHKKIASKRLPCEPRTRGARFRRAHPHTYYLLGGLGIVLFWRGIWGLLDHFLFPNYQLASFIVSALIGLIVLYLDDFSLDELRAK